MRQRHDGRDARDPSAGAHDDLAVDALAKDPVRRTDRADLGGGDRRGLQSQARLDDGRRGFVYDGVICRPAVLDREVVAHQVDVEAHDARLERSQRLFEKLLAGLVTFADDDGSCGHDLRLPSSSSTGPRVSSIDRRRGRAVVTRCWPRSAR